MLKEFKAECTTGHDPWEHFSERQADAQEAATTHNLFVHQSIASWEAVPSYQGGGVKYFASVTITFVNLPF